MRPRICTKNESICTPGEKLVNFTVNRTKFNTNYHRIRLSNVTHLGIHIHPSIPQHPGRKFWDTAAIFDRNCPQCKWVKNPRSAHVHLIDYAQFPRDAANQSYTIFAMMNMEAHSYDKVSPHANNTVIISFLSDSDIVTSYCCALGLIRRMCTSPIYGIGADEPPARPKCNPPPKGTTTAFYEWCRDRHGGDFFTCAFGYFPLLMQVGGVNRTGRPLAAAWVTATCRRHNNFLGELIKHMPVDMMGGCYKSRDEKKHHGVRLPNLTRYWPGDLSQLTNGERKVLLGSQYRFYIGVENTVLDDYVTEKFFQGFLMDAVMVYFGAPNAARYAPAPHSFIAAVDFSGPYELAQFLRALAADEERYEGYLAWKRAGRVQLSEGYIRAMRSTDTAEGRDSVPCRLCRLVSGVVGGLGNVSEGAVYLQPNQNSP
jgi:hypothetical protein